MAGSTIKTSLDSTGKESREHSFTVQTVCWRESYKMMLCKPTATGFLSSLACNRTVPSTLQSTRSANPCRRLTGEVWHCPVSRLRLHVVSQAVCSFCSCNSKALCNIAKHKVCRPVKEVVVEVCHCLLSDLSYTSCPRPSLFSLLQQESAFQCCTRTRSASMLLVKAWDFLLSEVQLQAKKASDHRKAPFNVSQHKVCQSAQETVVDVCHCLLSELQLQTVMPGSSILLQKGIFRCCRAQGVPICAGDGGEGVAALPSA